MADYHLSVQTINRAKGYSSVQAAAYRSGTRLKAFDKSARGRTIDYTRKGADGGVIETGIIGWRGSRQDLWNAAERAEKRRDATTAREIQASIPIELTPARRSALVRRYSEWVADRFGVAVDFAIHRAGGYARKDNNPHCHILFSVRAVSETGEFAPTKYRDFAKMEGRKTKDSTRAGSGKDTMREVREMWAVMANEALAEQGAAARIDHRSYAERGIDKEPGIHRGSTAKDQRQGEGWRTRAGSPRARVAKERATRNRLKEIRKTIAKPTRPAVDLVGPQKRARRRIAARTTPQAATVAPTPAAATVTATQPARTPEMLAQKRRHIEKEVTAARYRAAQRARQPPAPAPAPARQQKPQEQIRKGPRL